MIVDSSAIIAIIRREPDASKFLDVLESTPKLKMSAANFVEAAIVADRGRDPVVSNRFDDLIKVAEIELRPVTVAQCIIARQAYRDFGKGSGHKAQLNFGDCFAYALARELGEPMLFKGRDFIHTDVEAAV